MTTKLVQQIALLQKQNDAMRGELRTIEKELREHPSHALHEVMARSIARLLAESPMTRCAYSHCGAIIPATDGAPGVATSRFRREPTLICTSCATKEAFGTENGGRLSPPMAKAVRL